MSSTDLTFGDNDKAIFGAGSDLQIFHNGLHSVISEGGTGNLRLQGNDLALETSGGTSYLTATNNGAVSAFYAGSPKLATTSGGINVTGSVTADGLTVDGSDNIISVASNGDTALFLIPNSSVGADTEATSLYLSTAVGVDKTRGVKLASISGPANNYSELMVSTMNGGTLYDRLHVDWSGDISFYDPTGTNPSFVYDASGALVVNEDSRDFDFRIESNNNTNMLFVDGGNDKVGVGTGSPTSVLDVYSTTADSDGILRVYQNVATSNPTMKILQRGEGGSSGTNQGLLIDIAGHNSGDGYILNTSVTNSNVNGGVAISPFSVKGIGTFEFRQGGVINQNGADSDFRIESDGNANMIKVDAASNHVYIGSSVGYQQLTVNGSIAVGGTGNKGIYFGDNITSSLDQEWLLANNASNSNAFTLYEYDSGVFVKTRMLVESLGDFKIQSTAAGSVVINDDGEDSDFRVESNNDTHALYIDGTNGQIGLGTSVPQRPLHIIGPDGTASQSEGNSNTVLYLDNNDSCIMNLNSTSTGEGIIMFSDKDAQNQGQIRYNHADDQLRFYASGSSNEVLRMASDSVIFNEGSGDRDFRVESDSNTHGLFLDAGTGRVGIGNTAGTGKFSVYGDGISTGHGDPHIYIRNGNNTTGDKALITCGFTADIGAGFNPVVFGGLNVNAASGVRDGAFVVYVADTDNVDLSTDECMRVVDGAVFVGRTTGLFSQTIGLHVDSTSTGSTGHFNRVSDGGIVRFGSDGTEEGSVSISGTTVSYNGGHLARWSRLLNNSKDTSIVKGTVMTNLDEMVEWGDEENEQLNKMAVSSVEGDANVAGVFVNWDDEDDWNDMNVAMTGDMVIRIASGTTVARGDLLMSAGDGTAKPQGDDIVRSKTIAKVTSTHVSHTYDDGSYLVPCVLMAC